MKTKLRSVFGRSTSGEVGRLKNLRVSDEEFLREIQNTNEEVLEELLIELKEQKNECASKLRSAADEFHKSGIPSAPVWWEKTKTLKAIRDKHILMIQRQLELVS